MARSRLTFVAAVVSMIVGCAVLGFAAAASATPPERFHEDISEGDAHFLQCDGFEIGLSTTGTEDGTVFFDEAGEVVKVIVRTNVADVLTNSVTGKTVVNRGVFQETFTRIDDTDEFTQALTGFRFMGTSPGEGVVLQDVGRIVFSPGEEEILFLAGQHNLLDEEVDVPPVFCAALA
jgi:hypothetical protein